MSTIETARQNLIPISDFGERHSALYFLYSRIAAGMENSEPGSETIPSSMGKIWEAAASHIDIVAQENPKLAFDLALKLSLLPISEDEQIESVDQWIRGDGPILLAKDSLRKPLLEYLSDNEKSAELIEKMREYISYPIDDYEAKDAIEDPSCFLKYASIYLGTQLAEVEGCPNALELSEIAMTKLGDPEVSRIASFYNQFEDTAWLAEELEPFLISNPE